MSWTPPNQCARCGAEVIWGWTETGKRMPIDPPEYPRDDETANLAVYTDHTRRVRVRVLRGDRPLAAWEHRGMPHFATCPPLLAERAAKAAAKTAASRPPAAPPPHGPTARHRPPVDEIAAARARRGARRP